MAPSWSEEPAGGCLTPPDGPGGVCEAPVLVLRETLTVDAACERARRRPMPALDRADCPQCLAGSAIPFGRGDPGAGARRIAATHFECISCTASLSHATDHFWSHADIWSPFWRARSGSQRAYRLHKRKCAKKMAVPSWKLTRLAIRMLYVTHLTFRPERGC
jgi:hypothetical protein